MTKQFHLMDSPISASLNKRHFRDMDYDKPAIHNLCLDNITMGFTKSQKEEQCPFCVDQ